MRRPLSLTLSLAVLLPALVGLSAARARAQAVAAVSLERLREQYEQLLAIDRDPSTTPEVRQLNHTFLEERRASLREALKARIEAVRQYRSFAAATLTLDEKVTLEQSIRDLERQLRALGGGPRKAAAAQTPAGRTPPARRAPRANPRPAPVEASAAKEGPEPTPEAEDGDEPAAPGGKKEDEKKRPIVVASPAEGEDPAKGINVATREVELRIETNEPIDELQVTVFSGDEKKPKKSAKRVEINPSDKGKKSVVVQLARGKNTITVDDVARLTDGGVGAKRVINYTPPEDGTVVGGQTAGGTSSGGGTTLSATPEKWMNVPEAGDNVRVGYEGEAGKLYQFLIEKRDGTRQNVGSPTAPGDGGSVSAVFPELGSGDRVGIVEVENGTPADGTRKWISVESPLDETKGGPFGLMVGGVVMSQQAQAFQQADPFFGFSAGYISQTYGAYKEVKCGGEKRRYIATNVPNVFATEGKLVVRCVKDRWQITNKKITDQDVNANFVKNSGLGAWRTLRWNLRFQGIFQSDPRAATATNTTETDDGGGGGGGTTNEPFTFIASRKTFDLNAHGWIDLWANNTFTVGPYGAIGFSTILDKNELNGEAVTDGEKSASGDGEADGTTDTVATQARSDNDVKKYWEVGLAANIMLNRDLFAQAVAAYRRDEALRGLYDSREGCMFCDSQHRFAGKLRVFPFGLNRGFGRQVKMAPMFGVEVNAGRGPDHIKFFSGFAMRIKGINVSEAGGQLTGRDTNAGTGNGNGTGTGAGGETEDNPDENNND